MIILNKADQFTKMHDFARAYGTLGWNLSKVIQRKDLPPIYTMCLPKAYRAPTVRVKSCLVILHCVLVCRWLILYGISFHRVIILAKMARHLVAGWWTSKSHAKKSSKKCSTPRRGGYVPICMYVVGKAGGFVIPSSLLHFKYVCFLCF